MHPRPPFLAALLVASAAALPAQTRVPRDSVAHDSGFRSEIITGRDSAGRAYTVRRFGPARAYGGSGDFAFLTPPVEQRSVLGLWLGRADADGLRVDRVTADGPAARAGVAAGDRLTAVNGTPLRVDRGEADDPILSAVPARQLERLVGRLAPGSEVELRVARDGRERSVRARTVAPDALADGGAAFGAFRSIPGRAEVFVPGPAAPFGGPAHDSVLTDVRRRARALGDGARARGAARPVLGLTLESSRGGRDTLGLFVSAVAAGGPAERAGVVEGDRIAQVNGVDLRVPRDERDDPRAADARRARFTRELERLRPGDRVTLRVYGDGRWRTVTPAVARSADVYRADTAFRFAVPSGDAAGFAPLGPAGVRVTPLRRLQLRPLPPLPARPLIPTRPVRRTVVM